MVGNFEYILKRIQVQMNNSMRIAENTKKHISIEFLLDKFNVLNFKDRMVLNVFKILKRKVDRVRILFKKENYEWIEYSDGNITIIRSLSFPQNIKEEPPDKLIEKKYKTHDGQITIRKLWVIDRKLTRGISGYSILNFKPTKDRVKFSFFHQGIKYWNQLPNDIRNKELDKEEFRDEIILLLKQKYFERVFIS